MRYCCAEKLRFSNFKLGAAGAAAGALWSALRVLLLRRAVSQSCVPRELLLYLEVPNFELERSALRVLLLYLEVARLRAGAAGARLTPQRERFNTRDLRRGFAELKTPSCGGFAELETHSRGATSAEGSPSSRHIRAAPATFARRHSESASTRTISAEDSPSSRHIRAAVPPQRNRRAQDTFAQRHLRRGFTELKTPSRSGASAEGSPSSRHIRTAPQRERFDTHDLRKGFPELKTHSHSAAARALRHRAIIEGSPSSCT